MGSVGEDSSGGSEDSLLGKGLREGQEGVCVGSEDSLLQTGLREGQEGVRRKIHVGIVFVICIAVSWAGGTQLSKQSLATNSFHAPFFIMWFSTMMKSLCYPAYKALRRVLPALQVE